MDNSFVFKYGKHAGKTYGWVKENAPSYIAWAEENAPNLLKAPKPKVQPTPVDKKIVTFKDSPVESMEANTNFCNEGPHELSIPYLKKMEESKKDDWGF